MANSINDNVIIILIMKCINENVILLICNNINNGNNINELM